MIDTRFLTIHPRTALWLQEQRDKCAACANCVSKSGRRHHADNEGVMRCRVVRVPKVKNTYAYCIDAREPDSACGPEAKLFQPKE